MRDLEVSVGPCLELRVVIWIVTVTHLLVCAMEVLHVVFVDVRWSNVSTSTEPPNTTIRLKVAIVEMHGGAEWVLGVYHGVVDAFVFVCFRIMGRSWWVIRLSGRVFETCGISCNRPFRGAGDDQSRCAACIAAV